MTVIIEPAKFGMTGQHGAFGGRIVLDHIIAGESHGRLDAPDFIPRGSLQSNYHRDGCCYVNATELRPGVLA